MGTPVHEANLLRKGNALRVLRFTVASDSTVKLCGVTTAGS
jgi:hypothetical protein